MAGDGTAKRLLFTPFPPGTAEALRSRNLTTMATDLMDVVARAEPQYAGIGDQGDLTIRLGVEHVMRTFLDVLEHPERALGPAERKLVRSVGRAERAAGRDLEVMRRAFRVGLRYAWRQAAQTAASSGLPAASIVELADALFEYADAVLAIAVEGYLHPDADEYERRRGQLAALLVESDETDPAEIQRVATAAAWPVPRTLAAIAIAEEHPGRLATRLGVDVLAGSDVTGSWLLIPDPDGPGRVAELSCAASDVVSALGPSVAPEHAAQSLRWARQALELVQEGLLPSDSPTRTTDHLGTIFVLQDPGFARSFAAQRLGPLDGLAPADRLRLQQTLCAWLDHQRHVPSVAAALHVHRQTVRYRLAQLRELLGETLETPDGRFELALALRVVKSQAVGAEPYAS